jgi:hypothetical protein
MFTACCVKRRKLKTYSFENGTEVLASSEDEAVRKLEQSRAIVSLDFADCWVANFGNDVTFAVRDEPLGEKAKLVAYARTYVDRRNKAFSKTNV